MNHPPRLLLAALLAGPCTLFGFPVVAQITEPPASGQVSSSTDDVMPELSLVKVETDLAAIESNSSIEDAVKGSLRPKYQQAIDTLKAAGDNTAKAVEYRQAIDRAPETAADLRARLKVLPSAESAAKVTAEGSAEDLQKELDSQRAALTGRQDDLAKVTSELARVKGRPAEISSRLPQSQRELSDVRKQLASPGIAQDAPSAGRVADRILLQARQSMLLSEVEILKQEQSSQSVREELLQVQHELLTRQVENATAALDSLERLFHERLKSKVKRVGSLADTMPQTVPEGDERARALATEVRALAKQFEDVVKNLKQVAAAQNDIVTPLKVLTGEYDTIREQLKWAAGGRMMAQVLLNLERRIVETVADERTVQLPALGQTRMALFGVGEQLRRQPEVEREFADHSSDVVTQLVTTRREVLENLQTQYGALIRDLAKLTGDHQQYRNNAEDVLADIRAQLFWMQSSPPISAKTLTRVPDGLRWAVERDHWLELGRALQWVASRMPLRSAGIVLVVTVLLLARPRIGAALEQTGVEIRRISTDRYTHTVKALVWTSLLAVPVPLLIGFVGWAAAKVPMPNDWLLDFAYGLRISAWITIASGFLVAVCRPGGLGAAHFGWRTELLTRFRSAIHRLTVVYVPALLLTLSCYFHGVASENFDSVGRISFLLAHTWTAIVLWKLCCGSDGILATLTHEHPTGLITRWRYLWFPLVLACPLALIVLAGLGYLIAAWELSLGLIATVAVIAGGASLYGLTLRWFTMKQRKLALAEALERRRARREAAAAEQQQGSSGEIVSVDPEDEEEMDLASMSEQTRALLRLLFSLAAVVALIVYWSNTLPLIAVFETIRIPLTGGRNLLEIGQAVLILVVICIAAQNLPGLLELAVLRAMTIEAGTRYAITTLCRYAVIAVGLVLLFNVLNVDWAKFGWIAAALSVGLGFGLQEVVANFVCGIIVLFEQPIRVGDVVTLGGTTGTVTKIHMRATTITNWDRQDFVVPNKNLITGTILNWTLSAPLNRIVVPVGVAYGSDTERARQILLDVAAEHPLILGDPAPMATFEQFADSSLNLVLRAYLPDLDNRLGTITELNTEIHRRFAAAGIEIAFPQRDLHLRSGWEGTRRAGVDGAENEEKEDPPEHGRPIS